MFLLTQYLQFVLGYTPLEAGVRLLPMAAVMMVVAPASARLVERVGTKVVVGTGLLIASGGLLVAGFLTPGSTYPEVLGSMLVLAFGLALVMAPATESIMGSLPLAKAGVGSAVNDTTRQVGGALGVAVLGTLLAGTYSGRMQDAIAAAPNPIPPDVAGVITDQLGGALAIAGQLGGAPGQALADAARAAFVDGMGLALAVGAAVVALAAVGVFLFLPARARSAAPAPARHEPALPADELALTSVES
jgi:hypothetical protein